MGCCYQKIGVQPWGGSLQCDLSFFIFHVDNKAIKVIWKHRVFLDTNIDSFRAKPLVLQTNKAPKLFSQEVKCS